MTAGSRRCCHCSTQRLSNRAEGAGYALRRERRRSFSRRWSTTGHSARRRKLYRIQVKYLLQQYGESTFLRLHSSHFSSGSDSLLTVSMPRALIASFTSASREFSLELTCSILARSSDLSPLTPSDRMDRTSFAAAMISAAASSSSDISSESASAAISGMSSASPAFAAIAGRSSCQIALYTFSFNCFSFIVLIVSRNDFAESFEINNKVFFLHHLKIHEFY